MGDLVIELEKPCRAPVGRLWSALLAPGTWWGEEVRLEPEPGGAFHEPWRDADGEHHTRGQVLAIEPPSRLCLSWRDDDWAFETQVSFTLAARAGGSLLRLRHEGWQKAAPDAQPLLTKAHRAGWKMHLGNLVACAERAG